MNLEQQCVSLELARRLKELCIDQFNSNFYWVQDEDSKEWYLNDDYHYCTMGIESYSAYTIAELGEILQWKKLYIFGVPEDLLKFVNDEISEADTRAKMLIYLLENKLI